MSEPDFHRGLQNTWIERGRDRPEAGRSELRRRCAEIRSVHQVECLQAELDRAFRAAHASPVPRLETNSVINLCASVRLMGLASIIPEYFLEVLGPIADVRAVPLVEPLIEHRVGLVAVDRDPVSPLVLAAFESARAIEPPPVGTAAVGVLA